MSKCIYIVYKTINLVNSKFYIGKHKQESHDFDGYLGSGNLINEAIEKYGRENFIRETLSVHEDEYECYLAEEKAIGDLWKYRNDCYNLAPGGDCGMGETKQLWWDENFKKKEELSIAWKENNPSKTPEGRRRIKESNKRRIWTEEAKEKCGGPHRGKPKTKKVCPYCDRPIAINMYERYHNKNCKEYYGK